MSTAVISVALLFFLGHGLKWLFLKTKVPDLLILVGIGYVIGPVLGIVNASDLGKVGPFLTTLALIVILYEGGLSLRTKDLISSSLPALGLSLVGFFFIVIVTMVSAMLFAFQDWPTALLLGVGIGSTSSAIVIPMVKFLSIRQKTKTILSLESAFTDVLAIVIFLVLVDAFASGKFSFANILTGIGPGTLKSVLIGISSGLIWSLAKKHFKFISEIKFSGEAWAMLSYGLTELMGLNGAMGVLALGFTLANLDLIPNALQSQFDQEPLSNEEMDLLGEITFLLKTVFFIYLGMLVQFNDWKTVLFAIAISALIFVTRYITVRFLMKPQNYSNLEAIITTAMGPRGLACAVLATVPMQKGLAGGEWIQGTIFAIIPLTILFTALFVVLGESESFRSKLLFLFKKYPHQDSFEASPEV